jgi:cation:H+ antiporter
VIADIALVLGGLVFLVLGGDLLVKGAVNLALKLGITPLVVGLTVVAFGTSAPELIVSLSAALRGSTDIALGNVVGSNIANVLVILSAAAVVSQIETKGHDLRESWWMMVGASLLLILLSFMGTIGRVGGIVLLLGMALVLWRQLSSAKAEQGDAEGLEGAALGARWRTIILWLLGGLVALPVGAQLLVGGATDIARVFGISDAVIGLTLVAVGTSLPEMAASVAAAMRGRADLALGNVVGSNIFNILGILGITALIAPLPVPVQMLHFDLWVMLAAALLMWPFLFRAIPVGRAAGLALMTGYASYVWLLL